jgi:hypothetical protein
MTTNTSTPIPARFVRSSRAAVAALVGLSVSSLSVQALAGQNANSNPTKMEVLIGEVFVDFDASEIVISGANFDDGDTPEMRLGNDPIPWHSSAIRPRKSWWSSPASTTGTTC